MPGDDPLLAYMAEVAREARQRSGLSQARVAANLDLNQETIARFERGIAWPRRGSGFVYGYANEVGIDPLELFEEAVRRWRVSRAEGT